MKKIVLTLAATLIAISAVAQKVVVYPKTGEAITYNMEEIDHIEFLPASSEPSDEKSFTVQEFFCTNGENRIYGKFYRPKGVETGAKLPTVILSHSANLTADAMNAYASAIAEDGMNAYAFDFCGACKESRSDGNTEEMTVFTEVADLKAVIACIKAADGVDADKICLLGSSMGGLVSALTAEDETLGIKGLILFYPAFNIPDLIAMLDSFGGSLGNLGGLGGSTGMGYSEAFCNAMRGYDVYANIGTFLHRVAIFHGSEDIIVKISYSEKSVEKYPDATLFTIQGANHGFNSDNLGSFGSMMGGSADYDSQVIPEMLNQLHIALSPTR